MAFADDFPGLSKLLTREQRALDEGAALTLSTGELDTLAELLVSPRARPRAIDELRAVRMLARADHGPRAARALGAVLTDAGRSERTRVLAAMELGSNQHADAIPPLLAVARGGHGRLRGAAIKTLGILGDGAVLEALEALESLTMADRRRLGFAKTLIAHRHHLHHPALLFAEQRPAGPTAEDTITARLTRLSSAATSKLLAMVAGARYDLPTRAADVAAASFSADDRQWVGFVPGDALTQIQRHPTLAAWICCRDLLTRRLHVQLLALVHPEPTRLIVTVVRTQGDPALVGAVDLAAYPHRLTLGHVERPGATPLWLEATLDQAGLQLQQALLGRRRRPGRAPEPIRL